MIKKFDAYNESLRDKMKPKSDEEISNQINNYVTNLVSKGIDVTMFEEIAEKYNRDSYDFLEEFFWNIPTEQCIKIITEIIIKKLNND